jgi:hypothetical protein
MLLLSLAACGGGGGGGGGGNEPRTTMTITATVVNPGAIDVSWTPASTIPTRYELYVNGAYLGSSNATGVPVTSLSPGTRYCFVVYAIYFPAGALYRSNEACVSTPVDRPPTTPAGLTAVVMSPARIDLSWEPAADDWGIAGYRVHRDGALLATVTTVAYSDGAASPSTRHCYSVTAIDNGGNASPASTSVCATTSADTLPPSTPTGLGATAVDTTVTLTWNPSTDDGAVGAYRIERDGALVHTLPAPSGSALVQWLDANLSASTQYCYQVIAVDRANNASGPSNRACTTTSWQRSVIFAAPTAFDYIGERNALAVDSAGKLHVAYSVVSWLPVPRTWGPTELRYASNASGSWSSLPVVSDFAPYHRPAIAVDDSARVHMAFASATNQFPSYAQSANAWQVEPVSSDAVRGIALALDDGGTARLVYGHPSALRYASRATGAWSVTDAPGAGGSTDPAFGIDSLGQAHVVFLDSTNQSLRYSTNAGGTWATSVIEPPGASYWYSPALAMDGAGAVHAVYYDGAGQDLRYATNKSGAWQATVVDAAGDVGGRPSIAVTAAGVAHVAYLDFGNGRLKYATNESGAWRTFVLDNAGGGSIGWGDTAIGIDGTGRITILYHAGGGLRSAIH